MTADDNKAPAEQPGLRRGERPCPICGKPRSERYDPFCSTRCADVDLHRWLKGRYVIPGGTLSREPDDGDG